MARGSRATRAKSSLYLYGKREVSIAGRKLQRTDVAGIIEQKHFTGLYFMPIYSYPKRFKLKNKTLSRALKGKLCFHVTRLDRILLRGIDRMIVQGIKLYKKEGWI